jgi:6-phosphogluconolactonase (cycloisomerase 2 family)
LDIGENVWLPDHRMWFGDTRAALDGSRAEFLRHTSVSGSSRMGADAKRHGACWSAGMKLSRRAVRWSLPLVLAWGCGQSPEHGVEPSARARFLYAIGHIPNETPPIEVWGYKIDPASGSLSLLPAMPYRFPAPGSAQCNSLVHVPARPLLFAACDGADSVSNGQVYGRDRIEGLAIAPDGGLRRLENAPTLVAGTDLNVAPNGRSVHVSDPGGYGLSAFAVTDSGVLQEVPGSPFEITHRDVFPESDLWYYGGAFHPSGRYRYMLADRVVGQADPADPYYQLWAYDVDASTGAIGAGRIVADARDASYRAIMLFNPSGRFLYVATNDTVRGYAADASTGGLQPVPGAEARPLANLGVTHVAIDPQGRFLYVVGAVFPAITPGVWAYRIDAATGALALTRESPMLTEYTVSAGQSSNVSLVFDPQGTTAYLAGGRGVYVLRVNPETGGLQATNERLSGDRFFECLVLVP